MKVIFIHLVVYLCRICASVGLRESQRGTETLTLDISAPNPSLVDESKRTIYYIHTDFYKAKNGYMITSVRDGGVTIYKVPTDHSCEHIAVVNSAKNEDGKGTPWLVVIYAMNGEGKRMPFYYEKKDGGHDGHNGSGWKGVEEETFYSSFHKMAMREMVMEHREMDIGDREACNKHIITDTPKLPFLIAKPYTGHCIHAVRDGQTNVWNAGGEDERCMYASFYPRDGPILAYLMVSSDHGMHDLYLTRDGGSWNEVKKDEYLTDLKKAGFNESEFNNKIILDISQPDEEVVRVKKSETGDNTVNLYTPFLGFLVEKVIDGPATIWEASEEEHCLYINRVEKNGVPFILFLITSNAQGERKALHFVYKDDKWTPVDESTYFSTYTMHAPMDGQNGDPRIIMSSFRNRQGLRLTSYASIVDNPRGDIILIHGLTSHFMSLFCKGSQEWNVRAFGTPVSPYLKEPFVGDGVCRDDNAAKYQHLFEHACLDGMDALEIFPAYEYRNSFVECLNKLGYNVYGMDLQSYGLSESISAHRCYADRYEDYVYDLLQFISIVRRGKFNDTTEVWNEQLLFRSMPTGRRLILLGNSMGGNLIIQVVQEFYRMAKSSRVTTIPPIVDGIIGLSSMFDIDSILDGSTRRVPREEIRDCARATPKREYSDYVLIDYGKSLAGFIKFNDPFFYTKRVTYNVANMLFDACDDVRREDRMAHYPVDLPTLFIHSKEDSICTIDATRQFVETYLKDNHNAKLVELEGKSHALTIPQSIATVSAHINEWLNEWV